MPVAAGRGRQPVVNGHLTNRIDFTRSLDELATSLRAVSETWRQEGRHPICVSDADERSVLTKKSYTARD